MVRAAGHPVLDPPVAGQAAGEIRPDVDADEVLLLVGFLWRIGNDGWEKRAAHLLDLVMDGLRA